MFVLRNRLHVLAQYLRVKLPLEGIELEEIIKIIIKQVKGESFDTNKEVFQLMKSRVEQSASMASDFRGRILDLSDD